MFVLRKTFDALQLEWAIFKNKCEVLTKKVKDLTSELEVAYYNLKQLEKENDNMLRYIEYVESEKSRSNLNSFLYYKDFLHNRVNVPQKVVPNLYNNDVHSFIPPLQPILNTVDFIDFTLEKKHDGIKLEQVIDDVSKCISEKTKDGSTNFIYTDYNTKCKIEDNYNSPSYSNSSDDSSSSSSSSYSSSD